MKSLHKEDKRKVKHIGCKRFGIQYLLKGIYVHNDLCISTRKSRTRATCRLTWTISRSRLWTRRWRKQVLFPLRAYNYAVRVAGKRSERTVFCLPKFTIPDGKQLVVEMNEKDGGRHQTFTVENEDLVQAETINHGTGGSPAVPAEDAGHRTESRAERGGRLCAGSHFVKLRERREQVGVRGGISANQP